RDHSLCCRRACLPVGRPTAGIFFFFYNAAATTEIYSLSLHDALPISGSLPAPAARSLHGSFRRATVAILWHVVRAGQSRESCPRSEEHTSELQSRGQLVCRLLLEKKK